MFQHRFANLFGVFALASFLTACGGGEPVVEIPLEPEDVRPLLVGTQAPAFTVQDPEGAAFKFDPENLEKPVLMIFYRGGWCPYCNAQLMNLRHIEEEMLDLGFEALFLSADRPGKLKETLEGFEGEEMNYTLLSDNRLDAAKAFGIAYHVNDKTFKRLIELGHDLEDASGEKHHLLPVPAIFIIGTDGEIAFHYVNPNYKFRLEPQVILAAARATVEDGFKVKR